MAQPHGEDRSLTENEKCQKCKQEASSGDNFCSKCGTELKKEGNTKTPDKNNEEEKQTYTQASSNVGGSTEQEDTVKKKESKRKEQERTDVDEKIKRDGDVLKDISDADKNKEMKRSEKEKNAGVIDNKEKTKVGESKSSQMSKNNNESRSTEKKTAEGSGTCSKKEGSSSSIDSKMEQDKSQKSQKKRNDDIKVVFHVVVSPDFKLDPDNDILGITFEPKELSGWKNYKKMTIMRSSDGYHLAEVEVLIPHLLLVNNKKIPYKYRICNKNDMWEEIPKTLKTHQKHVNRMFYISSIPLTKTDKWHQYDGIMHRKPDRSVIERLWQKHVSGSYYKKCLDNTLTAVELMLPDFESYVKGDLSGLSTKEFIETVDQVYLCVKQRFEYEELADHSAWNVAMMKIFCKYMVLGINRLKEIVDTEMKGHYLGPSLALIHIVQLCSWQQQGMSWLDNWKGMPEEHTSILCKALLLQDDLKDFNDLVEHLKDDMTGFLLADLGKFIQKMAWMKQDLWVLVIPLYHFLHSKPQQRESSKHSLDHRSPSWWGTIGIEHAVRKFNSFQNINTTPRYIEEYMFSLSPLFVQDPLLDRTLMAVITARLLPEEYIPAFSPEAVLGNIYFDLVSSPYYDTKTFLVLMDGITKRLDEERKSYEQLIDEKKKLAMFETTQLQAKVALDVMMELTNHSSHRSTTENVISVLKVLSGIIRNMTMLANRQEEVKDNLQDIFPKVEWIVLQLIKKDDLVKELGVFSVLLNTSFGADYVDKDWENCIVAILYDQYVKLPLTDWMKYYDDIRINSYHSLIHDLSESEALRATENIICKEVDLIGMIGACTSDRSRDKLKTLLAQAFSHMWPEDDTDEVILEKMLGNPALISYFHLYSEQRWSPSVDDVKQNIQKALDLFTEVICKLMEGNVSVRVMEMLINQKHSLLEIQRISEKLVKNPNRSTVDIQILENLIKRNEDLMTKFRHQKKLISHFVAVCQDIGTDVTNLKHKLEKKEENLQLIEICHPQSYSKNDLEQSPELTYFEIDKNILECIEGFNNFAVSTTFHQILEECVQKAKKQNTFNKIQDVLDQILQPAQAEFMDLFKGLKTGEITLSDVRKYFGIYVEGQQLKAEFEQIRQAFQESNTWVKRCTEQVKHCLSYCQYNSGAVAMRRLISQLGLQGKYDKLDYVLSLTDTLQDQKLKSFNPECIETLQSVLDIDSKKEKCLDAFLKCQELVEWLKTSLEGTNQVKVLVDLAMITAHGQGDMEVKKVKCLHAAVTGYAPLIYELEDDDDFDRLLQLCNSVWRCLESDPKLPVKLIDTQDNLEWLKKVKESKGSVEINAFAQVEKINREGIYIIGSIDAANTKTYEDSFELVIPSKLGQKENPEKYTCQQLIDLQSRLMLIAGKAVEGKEQVDRFVEILDGVTRMAYAYLALHSAGCIIFKNWKASLYCDPERKINAQIEFGLSDRVMSGYLEEGDTRHQIVVICEFLDHCHDDWNKHKMDMREKYPVLNNFTTEQLVTLSKYFVVLCESDGQVPNTMYHLLNPVNQHCTLHSLKQAVAHVFQETERPSSESSFMNDLQSNSLCFDPDSDDEIEETQQKNDEFIDELTASGYSKKLALEALEEFGPEQLQEAVMWCMTRDEESSQSEKDMNQDVGESATSYLDTTIQQFTSDLLQNIEFEDSSLGKQLKHLWNKYIDATSMSVSEFVSIEHLGSMLTYLNECDEINRPFPDYLKVGQPNLLICPQGQTLQVILSLYAYADGKKKPLPQRDEVLLCSCDTTTEQVELLLRRAVFDKSGRLYCLADVGELNYDVAQKSETLFEEYCTNHQGIHVTVICTQETERHAHVANCLEQYKVSYPSLYDLNEIRNYLKAHFTNKDQNAASFVDPDCCGVRMVKSYRAGVGKSLKVHRLQERLRQKQTQTRDLCVAIPIQRRQVNLSVIMERFSQFTSESNQHIPRIFHIDLAHEVIEGVDCFLFNLLILGSIMDKHGTVWHRSNADLYLVETMPLLQQEVSGQAEDESIIYQHRILHLLPSLTCWSPEECLFILTGDENAMLDHHPEWHRDDNDQLIDTEIFHSESLQRPYQYLKRYSEGKSLNTVNPSIPEDEPADCLKVLMRYCGINDPSWAELNHFVQFLNVQLCDCEHSDFCQVPGLEQDLPDFKQFVVKFMISMSRDFATRSLNISEETPGITSKVTKPDLVQYILKRRWESSPHPYVFFNVDPQSEYRHSMTFLGFNVNHQGDIIDFRTKEILDRNVIAPRLQQGLKVNHVQLNENFDQLPRDQKIYRLCLVMGIDMPYDPDPTYELTTDNVQKILAIHMRFRCRIPVVVMGETGCGKTRLVKFMCDLQKPPGAVIQNLILMKVHGGTTEEAVKHKVESSLKLARENKRKFSNVDTVLFFDEANTTDAVGLLKEIMCDHRMMGQPLENDTGLKFIVACNPYRKHSEKIIKKLEQAGLGYHVKAEETKEKLGNIPMRQLVYRVHALPQSMLPLVWDFGQLDTDVEELYIRQMVQRYIDSGELPSENGMVEAVSSVLASSQEFMKRQKDECSFVSLRDADRVLKVMAWFNKQKEHIFSLMNDKYSKNKMDDESDLEEDEMQIKDVTRMLILALGVCYHASLDKRTEYREFISEKFQLPLILPKDCTTIAEEIHCCQEVFIDQIKLDNNIARNQALKENLFMMIICIELRIPLFLVGKPGSSKSLAKTIVDNAMQGNAAHCELFRHLKQVHMISFQCSPLSTPEGIVATFQQCAQLQHEKDLERYVATVVLDEVGLAEDSPLMPLKSLHPLLEDGCIEEEQPEAYKKVSCVAISNWALDPAKMNRGIHVHRGVPDVNELKESAKGICSTNKTVRCIIESKIGPLAEGYLKVCEKAIEQKREFFGLRDFYSLVKMIYGFAERSGKLPTWHQLKHAILRNFGGLENIDPVAEFEATMHGIDKGSLRGKDDPLCSPAAMIKANLCGDGQSTESRYLLILTENYAALNIMQQKLLDNDKTTIIFGSSFPKDQEYTQVCRNINRIKVCMETGCTVVLLNLDNLYESLYDALNQYYVKLGDARFVDLGLGTQRVKCEVHKDFKLVVVAEKQTVYNKYPIPLINRLEKHILTVTNVLTQKQKLILEKLDEWVHKFASSTKFWMRSPRVEDVFIGYHADTRATVVLYVCNILNQENGDEMWIEEVFERSQDLLLQCATPDAVLRLKDTHLAPLSDAYADRYYNHQKHDSLVELLEQEVSQKYHTDTGVFLQVTTHSKLLSSSEVLEIGVQLHIDYRNIKLVSIHAFDTEHQFSKMLKKCLSNATLSDQACLLLIQCESGDRCGNLIACARYIILDELAQTVMRTSVIHVVLVVQLSLMNQGNFIGFQGGRWICYHIDDLHSKQKLLPPVLALSKTSLAKLFKEALQQKKLCVIAKEKRVQDEPHILKSLTDEDTNEQERVTAGLETGSEYMIDMCSQLQNLRLEDAEQRLDVDGVPLNNCLNIDSLIYNCIHNAASMVRDYELDTPRKVKRVSTLLKLFEDKKEDPGEDITEGSLTILDVVNIRIYLLLEDKEKVTSGDPDSWLHHEAASLGSVKKAGTFRDSIQHYIESKLTLVLAGLISYVDKNRNLDLLVETDQNNWIYKFWIMMLHDPNITQLKYSDLQTLTTRSYGTDLREFWVETSACSNIPFSGRLPFSWIIYSYVNLLVYQSTSGQAKEDPEQMVQHLLLKSPIGHVLDWAHRRGNENDLIKRYLHDFVYMVYKPQSNDPEAEIKVITKCIRCAFVENHTNERDQSEEAEHETGQPSDVVTLTIPAIHLSFNRIQQRIHMCEEALQVWPEAVSKFDVANNDDLLTLFKLEHEMTLDVGLLYLLLTDLRIGKDFDNNKTYKMCRVDWLKKVERFHPVIERILNNMEEIVDHGKCGPISVTYYKKCRHLWSTIVTVHLFVQHVCPPEMSPHTSKLYKCLPLITMLSEIADLKTETSLTVVEKFLIGCNSLAKSIYFKKKKCGHCGETVDSPVSLICQHYICLHCVTELKELNSRICPECKTSFPADLDHQPPPCIEKEFEEHNQYKQRCNGFFMDLVSRLCFCGTIPPEKAVIKKLMAYVICEHKMTAGGEQMKKTGHLALFKESIDPTPVVRSFLLQLLLKSNTDDVRECLSDYFDSHKSLMADPQQLLEFCLLCIYCLEDHFFNYAKMHTRTENKEQGIEYICNLLESSIQPLTSDKFSFRKLEAIAGVRFALGEVATLLHAKYVDMKRIGIRQRSIHRLCQVTREVCLHESPDELSKTSSYLMKKIFSQFGQPALQKLSNQQNMQWIIPESARDNEEIKPDIYAALGEEYVDIRELISEVLLGKDVEKLGEQLESQKEESECVVVERNLLLSLYREITTGLTKSEALRPDAMIVTNIGKLFSDEYKISQQDLLGRILTNRLSGQCSHLKFDANQDDEHTTLLELLLHYWIVMNTKRVNTLLKPLWLLINEPQNMKEAYLPTMPEDHFEEVRAALMKARRDTYQEDSHLTFWECPNGHPYVIGNCGRPIAGGGVCPECGAAIGGSDFHVAVQGNREIGEKKNTTASGHILGQADQRTSIPIPERLNPLTNSILRIMVHMSMYLGANMNSQSICELVHPQINPDALPEFLWQHLRVDLKVIGTALGRNREDSLLLIHLLLDRMIANKAERRKVNNTLRELLKRKEWEMEFTKQCVTPVLENLEEMLSNANQKLVMDKRLGNNVLLRVLYEVSQQRTVEGTDLNLIQEESSVWSLRSRVTVEQLTQTFQKSTKQHACQGTKIDYKYYWELLELFLQEEHHLRLLRHLPNILQLQQTLSQKIHLNMERNEAMKMTIGEFRDQYIDDHLRETFEEMVKSFGEAWYQLRGEIGTFAVKGSTVQAEYCEQIVDDQTVLAMLLPNLRGQGLCAVALVHRLVQIHNDFMENYLEITKQSTLVSISSHNITQSHVVSYDLERDLMPVILANCNYTLTPGHGLSVGYDFKGLSKQIEERFIRGRPQILPQVNLIVYREEYTDASVFTQLQAKVKQEPIDILMQQQICKELRHLTEFNDSLAMLDVVLRFLTTVGGSEDMTLQEFVIEVLRMDCGGLGKAAQKCNLGHTQSLWLLLSHERAKLLCAAEQDAFDMIPVAYHEDLGNDATEHMLAYLKHLPQLDRLLPQLFECIMLHVDRNVEDRNAEAFVDSKNQPLQYVLDSYSSSHDYAHIPSLTDGRFPEDVCLKHCITVWKLAFQSSCEH